MDYTSILNRISRGESITQIAQDLNMPRETLRDRLRKHREKTGFKVGGLLSLAKANQQSMENLDPIITTTSILIPELKPVPLAFMSCAHLGSRYTDYEKLEEFVNYCFYNNVRVIMLGDDVDGYELFDDVATRSEQALPHPLQQRGLLIEVIKYLQQKGLVLAAFSGQHGSQWQRRETGVDSIKLLYSNFSIPYFDGQGLIRLSVGEQHYQIFAAHKLPKRDNSDPLSAQRKLAKREAIWADMIVGGDSHQYAVQGYYVPHFPNDRWQWLVQVGTLKVGSDPYTIRSYSHGQYGYPVFLLHSDEHKIDWVSVPETLPSYLELEDK